MLAVYEPVSVKKGDALAEGHKVADALALMVHKFDTVTLMEMLGVGRRDSVGVVVGHCVAEEESDARTDGDCDAKTDANVRDSDGDCDVDGVRDGVLQPVTVRVALGEFVADLPTVAKVRDTVAERDALLATLVLAVTLLLRV